MECVGVVKEDKIYLISELILNPLVVMLQEKIILYGKIMLQEAHHEKAKRIYVHVVIQLQ